MYPKSLYLIGVDTHFAQPTSYNPIPGTTIITVAKNSSASYCSFSASATSTAIAAATKPDGVLSTVVGEGWVFGPYTGVFTQNTMSISMSIDATTVSSQQGQFRFRIWKASDVSASNPILITPGARSTQIAAITAATNLILSASFAMTTSVTMNNEYLFVEAAWGITTAGGSNSADVRIRHGSASVFRTGPFEDNTVFIVGDDNPGLT